MIEINYVFSIGYRCNSPNILNDFGYRKISGPFDYLFIDIETAFYNIHTKFNIFLKDIVLINKNKKHIELYYSKNKLNKSLDNFIFNTNVSYMKHNYNDINIIVNQNFIDNISNNLYNWNRICNFAHHHIFEKDVYNKLNKRIDIFKELYDKYCKNMCLFYITKIEETTDYIQYKKNIFHLKQKYNINAYIIIIICSDKLNEVYDFENNILYIIKKVPNYIDQYNSIEGTDNNFKFIKEKSIIDMFFNFNLSTYDEIHSKFMI